MSARMEKMIKNHVSSLIALLLAVVFLFAFCISTSAQPNAFSGEEKQLASLRGDVFGYSARNYKARAKEMERARSKEAASISLGTEKQLSDMSQDIAEQIYKEMKRKGGKRRTPKVAVTVAVPLSDLKRESEFGRMLAEYILTDLAGLGLRVAEIRLGKEILIVPQTGEFVMSRNSGELKMDSPKVDYVVVSTFTNTRSTLILQGRLVDMRDGIVQTSWRYTMPLNREIIGLFYDPREVRPSAAKPFKMVVKGLGE